MEKHYFAGNNTSKGFYNYFSFIFNPESAKRIYILKGGPGVGKSSFMRKIATKVQAENYSVDYIHCASDNESLDGIYIPERKIAFVDGTAPHTIDPSIPGAADEIINLGAYLNSNQLEKMKAEIIQCNKTMSRLYKSAYRFLSCAGVISEELDAIYDTYTDYGKFNTICNEVIDTVFHDKKQANSSTQGYIRKLFTEAYTADGYINYTASICRNHKVWAVTGKNTNLISVLLNRISSEASARGYSIDRIYSALHPDKLQHVYISDLDLMIISGTGQLDISYEEIIHLNLLTDDSKLDKYRLEIQNNILLYDLLIKNALEKLAETKKVHSQLEAYYIDSMDFKGVDLCFDSVLSSLEAYL